MESDREIIRNVGIVLSDGMSDVCLYTLKTALCASIAGYVTYRISKKMYVHHKVKSVALRLRKEKEQAEGRIQETIDRWKECEEYAQLLSVAAGGTVEDYISSLPFMDLVQALQKGELTAYSVLKAYQIKAIEQQKSTNCIVGWIEEADTMARSLDLVAAEDRKPLHGVPVSVKECFYVKNTYSTAGMIKFTGGKDSWNCPAVQNLIALGAVPYCKTNVPQTMYSMECTNPLYGTTCNPHNPLREAGGSSGGEAALIGGGGSILGIGSDIGGSLRNPAAFCGIYSMKPTIGRHLCYQDVVESAGPSPAGCQAVGGFMSSSAKGLEYSWRSLWNLKESENEARFDGSIAPVPFNQDLFAKKMKVGFFFDDGILEAVPAVKRAVLEAVEVLRRNSYEVTLVPPPDIQEVATLFNGLVMADVTTFADYISWDITSSAISGICMTMSLLQLPRMLRRVLLDPLLALFTRVPPLETLFTNSKDLQLGLSRKEKMCRRYFQMMEEAGVEVIISPGQSVPAVPLGVAGTFMPIVLPYITWNMLNMPTGVAPITRYTEADHLAMSSYPSDDLAYKLISRYCEGAEGLPLAVQVSAKPYHEEQVLQILNLLEQHSNYR